MLRHRSFAGVVAFTIAVTGALAVPAADPPKKSASRSVEVTFKATVPTAPVGKPIDVWVPRPLAQAGRDFQTVEEPLSVLQVHARKVDQTPWIFHATTAPNDSFSLTWIARVERKEQTTEAAVLASQATDLSADEKKSLAHDLEPEKANAFTDAFLKRARAIAPDEKVVVKLARAIYDHVVTSLRYEKPAATPGWGHGSTEWACREGYGNCTDFSALFMDLCRARGIPTRYCLGVELPADRHGQITGYHCWAEFYVPGGHWVPVDASDAWKKPEKRDDYFGNLDADRLLLVRGRDVVLAPPQKGPPISLFKLGYAETPDGTELPVECDLSYEDIR